MDFRDEVLQIAWRIEWEKRLKALRVSLRKAGFTYFAINKVQPEFQAGRGWDIGHMYARGAPNNASKFWDLLRKHKVHMGCGNGSRGKDGTLHQAQMTTPSESEEPDMDWRRRREFMRALESMGPREWDLTKDEHEEAQREGAAGQADPAQG